MRGQPRHPEKAQQDHRRLLEPVTPGPQPALSRRPHALRGIRARFTPSIRVRLTLWYGAILALVLIVSSGAVYATEQQSLLAQADSQLMARLHRWAGAYDTRSGRLAAAREPDIAQGTEIVLLLTPAGRVVQALAAGQLSAVKVPWDQAVRAMQAVARGGTPAVVEQGLQIATPAGTTKDGFARGTATQTQAAIFRLTGLSLAVRGRVAALLVVGRRSDVPQQMAILTHTLETIVPLTLLLCAGGGYWLAGRALRPMLLIARTAQEIGATDLSRRLSLRGRDEVALLAATIDGMLARLEAAFARQRRFTADAGHELRTPLAIIDLEASRALARPRTAAQYRQAIAVMQQETAHMTRLIDDLLTLARADSAEAARRRAAVELDEVVLDVVERLAPLAQRSAMALTIEALPAARVWGEQDALTRMLTNVVENALKYGAGYGTQVWLSAGVRRHGEVAGVWLQVADDGPGIAAEHLPHVCERFYRADRARTHSADVTDSADAATTASVEGKPGARAEAGPTGSGLGLAISQGIAEEHGGSLHVQAAPGHGVVVEIWLPLVDGVARANPRAARGL